MLMFLITRGLQGSQKLFKYKNIKQLCKSKKAHNHAPFRAT